MTDSKHDPPAAPPPRDGGAPARDTDSDPGPARGDAETALQTPGASGRQDTERQVPPGARRPPSSADTLANAHAPQAGFVPPMLDEQGTEETVPQLSPPLGSDESGGAAARPALQEPLLQPGERVDQYEVVRAIGQGGMGAVYLARDALLGRKVALKVVHPHLVASAGAVERFLFEARATARFNHPNIVTIFGLGQVHGCPYVVLEYLAGTTLRARLRDGPLAVGESISLARRVALALEEAHRQGILHCDLKPENVLLPRDGRLRVLDFGLAKLVEKPRFEVEVGSIQETVDGPEGDASGIRGTAPYMAPEQWQSRELGPASDIWAFGVTFYEMLCGERPFRGSPVSIYQQVTDTQEMPVAPADRVPGVPASLSALCLRCLERDPAARPTAGEIAAALAEVRTELRGGTQRSGDESPYRGLSPFKRAHADLFFGREAEIAACVERLRETPLLAVVGASGAGKSSFAQAGVIPRLEALGAWQSLVVRPGRAPFRALVTRLERTSSASTESGLLHPDPDEEDLRARRERADQLEQEPATLGRLLRERARERSGGLILVVDQFEEVFTLASRPEEREAFCKALLFAADDPEGPVRVLLTMREDFLSRLALYPEFIAEVSRGIVVIRTPGPAALGETLEAPARLQGYRFEDDALVPAMVKEVAHEPAGLPLLQFAVARLWEGRDPDKKILRRSTYEAIGGVAGALAEHADAVMSELMGEAAQAAREVLLRLVTPEGTRASRREDLLLSEVGPGGREAIDHLVASRLLVSRRATTADRPITELELVHESLITRWTRLRRWLDETRDDVNLRAELEAAVQQWRRRGRRDEDLWRGRALQEALDWKQRQRTDPPGDLRAFIERANRLARKQASRRIQLQVGLVAGLVLLAVAVGAFLWVRRQEQRARHAHHIAVTAQHEARTRLAAALLEGAQAARLRKDLAEARAKLRASFEVADSVGARALFSTLLRQPLIFRGHHPDSVFSVAASPRRSLVATGTYDGSIRIWDWETGTVRVLRGHRKEVFSLAFSPDGRRLASGAGDGNVRIWDLATGRSRVLSGHLDRVYAVAFDATGQRLASASGDGVIKIWPARGGAPKTLRGHRGRVNAVAFGHAGRRLFSAGDDRTVRIWDLATGQAQDLRGHKESVLALATDPSGARIASAGDDGTIRIWDLDRRTHTVLRGHRGAVTALDWDPRGARLASGGEDRTIRIWELDRHRSVVLGEHQDRISSLQWSPDGQRIAVGSYDRTLTVWDVNTPPPPPPAGHTGWVSGVAFNPNGEQLASASQDRTVRLWNLRTGTSRALRGHTARVIAVAYHPSGKQLASAAFDNTIRIWDLPSGRSRVLRGHTSRIYGLAYSRDGRQLASGSWDRTVRIWDPDTGQSRVLRGHTNRVFSVDFSPDGKSVVSGAWDRTLRIWNLATGKARVLRGHTGRVAAVAWAPSGNFIASAGYDRTLRIWDPVTGKARVLKGHRDYIWGVAISPDSRVVATASRDRTIRLWDVASGRTLRVLKGHTMDVNRVAFHPRLGLLASGSDDTTVRLWELPSGRPRWRARALLTGGEARLVTGRGLVRLSGFGRPAAPLARARNAAEARLIVALDHAAGPVCTSPDGRFAAVVDRRDHVQLWSAVKGRVRWERSWPGLARVVCLSGSVAVLGRGAAALLHDATSPPRWLVKRGARLVTTTGGHLLVVTRDRAHSFDLAGHPQHQHPVDPGVTAALLDGNTLYVGYRDGTVERFPHGKTLRRQAQRPFEGVPSQPVTRLLAGPMQTLAIGFRDGTLGLWNLRTGKLLEHRRLHGAVRFLRREGRHLYAATELGNTAQMDLSIFHQRHCEILKRIWDRFPARWDRGRPVRSPPPVEHPCRGTKPSPH